MDGWMHGEREMDGWIDRVMMREREIDNSGVCLMLLRAAISEGMKDFA